MAEQPRDEIRAGRRDAGAVQHLGYAPGGLSCMRRERRLRRDGRHVLDCKDGWKRRGATWKEPGFKQGPTNPVVGVSWDDVKAFCEWLTKRERGSGALPKSMNYRLPTDIEWSVAVGLDSEPGNTPEEKSSKINLYPWGTKCRRRLDLVITLETNRKAGP